MISVRPSNRSPGLARPTERRGRSRSTYGIRPDLALLEVADEDAIRPPCKEARQIGLSQGQREGAEILAIHRQHIEGAELYLLIVPAPMQRIRGRLSRADRER